MIDTIYFTLTLALLCFVCTWLGWSIGYEDAKKKYRR
jgi:hypothetical protein